MIYLLLVIVLQWAAVGYLLFDARRERDRNAKVLADFAKAADRERQTLLAAHPGTGRRGPSARAGHPPAGAGRAVAGLGDRRSRGPLTKEQLAEAIDGRND
jgi:hypothetical protein